MAMRFLFLSGGIVEMQQELGQIVKKQFMIGLTVIGLFAVGYTLTSWETIFAGLILGMLFGLYNMWTLVRRYKKFDQAMAEGRRGAPLGTLLRFISAIAAVSLAMAFPNQFDLISTVIGFALPYVLLIIERIVYHAKHDG